jgi:hypothetical protein
MKKLLSLLALGLTLTVGVAHAAGEQQNKMKTCNADAKGKKGDERKAFMKECLSAKADAPAPAAAASAVSPACEKSAADKKLHGAAKNAHIKKCMADGK